MLGGGDGAGGENGAGNIEVSECTSRDKGMVSIVPERPFEGYLVEHLFSKCFITPAARVFKWPDVGLQLKESPWALRLTWDSNSHSALSVLT